MPDSYPRIPYGEADFRRIRLNGWLYVDKTRFLRRLEDERYVFLIRPQRFGKSLWLSVLENYYDRRWKPEFEAVFGGTDIGRNPTAERHRYVVLRFDFSMVNDGLATLEREFEAYCDIELKGTLELHSDLFPAETTRDILAEPSITAKLAALFQYVGDHDIPLYVLIDEYDNFANTILAHHGDEAYRSFFVRGESPRAPRLKAPTHGGGFYRSFFATLKGGAGRSGGGLERLFITGVSPVTMDGVTSGFNVGTNISLKAGFSEMVGFTADEVRGLVDLYRERGALGQNADEAMALMAEWYSGYRFAEDAGADMYNSDMVLYYLKHSIDERRVPRELIDMNVRIDYGKLRHLLTVGRRLEDGTTERSTNGNFDLLRGIVADERVDARIQTGFPVERLADRENFLSLMHYFGLLSIRELADGVTRLGIPNQTVRQLMYGYLRDGFRDVGAFDPDLYAFERLLIAMANKGEWRPVFEFLAEAIAAQSGIRDYIAGEKFLQGFFAAFLGFSDFLLFRSEAELGKGYADIVLEPLLAKYPHLQRGYLIELKYLKQGESDARIEAASRAATAQLRRYVADERLARQHPDVRFTGLVVVFRGWEMVVCDAAA